MEKLLESIVVRGPNYRRATDGSKAEIGYPGVSKQQPGSPPVPASGLKASMKPDNTSLSTGDGDGGFYVGKRKDGGIRVESHGNIGRSRNGGIGRPPY